MKPITSKVSRSYVMGIGADYDERLLLTIRNSTNGEFVNISSPEEITGKFNEISQNRKKVLVQAP